MRKVVLASIWILLYMQVYDVDSPPTLSGAGHQWTVRINIDYIKWLSLAKPTLKVAHAGGDHSLVARINKCEWTISS